MALISSAEIAAYTRAVVTHMLPHIKQVHNMPNLAPRVLMSFKRHRTTSYGGLDGSGNPYISLVLRRYALVEPHTATMTEYASYRADPVIGSVKGSWKKAIAALVAHELAHVVQVLCAVSSRRCRSLGIDPSEADAGHGDFWKGIYRDLRVNFVNNGECETVAYTVPVPVVPVVKRVTNRKPKEFTVEEENKYGGRIAYYFTPDRVMVGALFKREFGKVQVKIRGDHKYTITSFTKVAEARKALIEPLIKAHANKTHQSQHGSGFRIQ